MTQVALTQPIVSTGPIPSYCEVDTAIQKAIGIALDGKNNVGLLLSGGVDSTVLLSYVVAARKTIPVFTIASDPSLPDLAFAQDIAKTHNLQHYVLLPGQDDIDRAQFAMNSRQPLFSGDIAVYLALEMARNYGILCIVAADGIDELTGGYWWHAHASDRFASEESAFRHFWNVLEAEHIEPMNQSADSIGIEVVYPFLDRQVVETLTRIPLHRRVAGGVTKQWWKQFAQNYVGIPECIVTRPKLGFVSALDKSFTMNVSICGEAQ